MSSKVMQTDVLIAGGGPVGLMLAIGLARKHQRVMLVEKFAQSEDLKSVKNSFDGRVLALSYGSKLILENLGIWEALAPYTTPIEHVHVSQQGYLGLTKLHASEANVPALGYSIQSSDLGKVLWQQAKTYADIEVLCPATVIDFVQDEQQVSAQIELNGVSQTIISKLLVGADGTDSMVRQVLNLPLEEKSYEAFGIIAQIESQEHPQGWSFERFTEEGPVALLPMQGHFHKAVLVCPQEQRDALMALDDETFIAKFSEKMGERMGGFVSISPRMAYPLKETYVPEMVVGRTVLMGNASHTQHPVAAQGLNLGIRDIGEFLDALQTVDNLMFLPEYAAQRQDDHEKVMGLTDGLIQVFQHGSPMVGHLRGVGLMAMQALPGLRKRFTRFAMGGS